MSVNASNQSETAIITPTKWKRTRFHVGPETAPTLHLRFQPRKRLFAGINSHISTERAIEK